ncbi:MAG TPA: hypothetical protein DEG43_02785 [Acidimicrobiaceae bacterium]|jgi:hypothetical protein|nr:hypothetical protein [Acidimicrobiaceae bacterium]
MTGSREGLNAPAKLGLFLAGSALTLLVGFGVGRAVGPIDSQAPAHESPTNQPMDHSGSDHPSRQLPVAPNLGQP